jgi:ribosomal protein S19E (S16A)
VAREAVEKVARYRERQRARGLRPVELWVHDTGSPAFLERLWREAEAIRAHARTKDGRAVEALGEALFDEMMEEVEAEEERARASRR